MRRAAIFTRSRRYSGWESKLNCSPLFSADPAWPPGLQGATGETDHGCFVVRRFFTFWRGSLLIAKKTGGDAALLKLKKPILPQSPTSPAAVSKPTTR